MRYFFERPEQPPFFEEPLKDTLSQSVRFKELIPVV